MTRTEAISLAVAALSLAALVTVLSVRCGREPEVSVIELADTVYVTRTDTVRVTEPVYVHERTVDTLLVHVNDTVHVPVPVVQRMFSGPDYEAWVSGYEPRLDSLNIFRKTEYRYIDRTVERTVHEPERLHMWVNGGFLAGRDVFIPEVYLTLQTRGPVSVSLGTYWHDGFGVRAGIGYRIF